MICNEISEKVEDPEGGTYSGHIDDGKRSAARLCRQVLRKSVPPIRTLTQATRRSMVVARGWAVILMHEEYHMVGTAPTRIGLISDCEGNVAALAVALAAMKRHAPDLLVLAGDILKCPFSPDPPGETIALLRSENILTIPGNNDRYLIDWDTPRWPHTLWMRLRRADPAGGWLAAVGAGQAQIPPADLAWLRALPEEMLVTEGVWVCHGMPGNPWNSIWPRHSTYDANVSAADRDASLHMLATVDAELVLCGHVPTPWEYDDRLPDGRALRVVRAGPREKERVGYAVLTRTTGRWQVEWCHAEIPATPR